MFSFKDFVVAEDKFIRKDLMNFAEAMDEINTTFNLSPLLVEDFQNALKKMHILLKEKDSPSNYFSLCGWGAYKEVYDFDSHNTFVIKFCGRDNETEKELDIIRRAQEFGVGEFFIPTFSVPINSGLIESLKLEGDSEGKFTYNSKYHTYVDNDDYAYGINHILIQPKIFITVRNLYGSNYNTYEDPVFSRKEYEKDPVIINGKIVPYVVFEDFPVSSLDWIKAVYSCGLDLANKLWEFFEEENIHDLHNNNIGYLKEDYSKPVIIDWLSS